MTKNNTATATATSASENADSVREAEQGVLEHLDPNSLIVDTNVRNVRDLKADFVASIKENGVLMPIVAVRASDGTVLVRMGQRRTLAAREAGLARVPVYVRPLTDDDDATRVFKRVTQQIVENVHRDDITASEHARGIQQMLDAGISVTKVAKSLTIKRDTVKAAAAAGKSSAAMTALESGQLSLDEAAAVSEFDGDDDAVNTLIDVAGTHRFAYRIEQFRKDREARRAYEAAATEYRERGFRVIDDEPEPDDTTCVELQQLLTENGEPATDVVITDPAQWVVYLYETDGFADAETGEIVSGDSIDWSTEGDDDATPAEGMRHANSVVEALVYVPEYYCVDYQAAGLTLSPSMQPLTGRDADLDGGEDPEGDRAVAAAEAEVARAEQLRRARRKVRVLNRLGDAAGEVRRQFVTKLLARKTPPKGASIFVATALTREQSLLNEFHGPSQASQLLGISDASTLRAAVADLPPTGDARAQVIVLGLVLGALESRTPKDAWRDGGRNGYSQIVSARDYLRFLTDNGYSLTDVEEVILGDRSADEVYDATLHDRESDASESGDDTE